MYGGSNRYGRGGGGGRGSGGKRSMLPMVPPHRPSSSGGGSRHSVGGSSGARGRNPSTSTHGSGAPVAAEETFSLVSGNSLSYAAIIRLAPSLVEEIKRVEAEGGAAKIKFDANPNHASGNVINVGGKEFRFSWSREMGHCDIYEEHQGGDNGNGILVESGCPWRKLNVQRVLDESTKNHVKMRSEEAERKSRARKAIVLDPGNPSTKSQIKALAAVEASPWKNFKQKKDPPFKKRKIEPPQAAAPPKSVYKSGFPSTNYARGRQSTSPLLSTPDRSGCLASPSTAGNFGKAQATSEDMMHTPVITKENILNTESVGTGKASSCGLESASQKVSNGALSSDLQSMLFSLLKGKPSGMSLKALGKAVGDAFPNSACKIEPILKKIATFQAPGRYYLRPEVDMESSKKCSTSGSSPEDNHPEMSVPEDNQGTVSAPPDLLPEKSPAEEMDEQATLTAIFGDDADLDINVDTSQHSQEQSGSGDKKVSDHSDGQVGSSSDSGSDSDSDSDSSESGSDSGSRSRSRSRSPGGSASRSSSDTESDSSSNSKQGSDVDVDIMTSDDEKEPKHELQVPEAGLSTSTPPWRSSDGRPMQNGTIQKQDDDGSEDVDIEDVDIEDLPYHDQETDLATAVNLALNADANSTENCILYSPNQDENPDHQINNVSAGKQDSVTDVVRHENSDKSERSRGKSRKGSDVKQIDDSSEHVKNLKSGSSAQSSKPGNQSRGLHHLRSPLGPSPGGVNEGHYKDLNFQMINRHNDDNNVSGFQRGYSYDVPGKSVAQLKQSGGRTGSLSHDPEAVDNFSKLAESSLRNRKYREKTTHSDRSTLKQKDKFPKEIPGKDINLIEKSNKKSKDRGPGNKQSGHSDIRKYDEQVENFCLTEHFSDSHMISSPKDHDRYDAIRSPVVKRSGVLQRELSDLELGELREPLFEGPAGDKKQFQRKGSFKQSETKVNVSDSWNATLSKGKSASKSTLDSGKLSSPLGAGILKGAEAFRKKSPDSYSGDPVKLSKTLPSHQQHSAFDRTDVRSLSNKTVDIRQTGAVENQEMDVEDSGETHRKSLVNTQSHELGQVRVPLSGKGSKSKKSNSLASSGNKKRGTALNEGHDGNPKKSESSSDENSSFSKYEKEEPELKGPITNHSQYKEYVQEYHEKYDSYCSLNKILESYRNKFQKLGRELESAKSRDTEKYYFILGQLRESYLQCGTRHKRLKKIFVVLHKELTQLKERIKEFAETYTRA